MAELPKNTCPEAGFTLAEMLAALGILLFGVTALLGAMTASVAQRRSTDAQHEAVAVCEHALLRIQEEGVRRKADAASSLDLELASFVDQPAPGFDGMTWSARAVEAPDRPDVWLVQIDVSWLDAGEATKVEFLRILPRQMPLRDRVLRFREERSETPAR